MRKLINNLRVKFFINMFNNEYDDRDEAFKVLLEIGLTRLGQ